MEEYVPSKEILDKYADVLVNFALNAGEGVKPGQVVLVNVPESARLMYDCLYQKLILAKANPIMKLNAEGNERFFFENATKEQLDFFPEKYFDGLAKQVDQEIHIIATTNPKKLVGINSKLLFQRQKAIKPFRDKLNKKEDEGNLFWTLGMYGTSSMAKEAGMPLKEYWDQIITACYLDKEDPVYHWKQFKQEADILKAKLDNLDIEYINVKSERTDLTVGIGKDRKWLGASCHNIPSFELFISPDWRQTRGHIQFTESLYYQGNLIEDVYVEFNDSGMVQKATASQGEDVLLEMIKQENANKVGEFSLTDRRFSKITKFMAQTLFDENVGGPTGNTHIALGNAYRNSYTGNLKLTTEEEWSEMGFNKSGIHTDIVSTENRVATATLRNGKKLVIYKNGEFTV